MPPSEEMNRRSMRTLTRILLASSGAAFAVLSATPAFAQKDIQPSLPNVLLLIDNSGSMEFLIKPPGKLPGDPSAPNTQCDGSTMLSAKNRWANLVTVLTGSIADTNFSCHALDRHSAAFVSEFTEQGTLPYDKNYYLPFNRIYSNGCSYGAGTLPSTWNWWDLPSKVTSGTYKDSQWVDASGSVVSSCNFKQASDGLLDSFRGLVRFGMMTLDTFPDPGTGSTTTSSPSSARAAYPTGSKGMWSYFHNWIVGAGASPTIISGPPTPIGGPGAGNPAGCGVNGVPTPSFFEVGARNQAAPPWEGRLVPFGDPDSDAKVPVTNDQIQLELLASRPYGATPIAALLDDANEFLFHDQTTVPNTTHWFGPSDDKYWINGCRSTTMILMSDGLDNMDLRAKNLTSTFSGKCQNNADCANNFCDPVTHQCQRSQYNGCDSASITPKGGGTAVAGNCPYMPADQIALRLHTIPPPNQRVSTYVVGFTGSDMTKFNPVPTVPSGATTCDKLTASDCAFLPLPATQPSPEFLACCQLQKIAFSGGTTQAYFADDPVKLKTALAGILSQISSGTTDRTSPVYAPAGNRAAEGMAFGSSLSSAAYQFAASFKATVAAPSGGPNVGPIAGGPWTGSLVRERFSCGTGTATAVPQTIHPELGDDYALNLDYADSANPRRFFTVIGADVQSGGHGNGNGNGNGNNGNGNGNNGNGNQVNSDYTIRPYIGAIDDGFGTYAPNPTAPSSPQAGSTFPTSMASYAAAFNIPSDQACDNAFNDTSATNCTNFLVNWEIGGNNTLPAAATFQTRDWKSCPTACPQGPTACACRQLGAIFHSTPAVVGPPREFLRDDSYTTYANTPAISSQETMLYTATMDGQLHAFKVQAGNTSPDNFFTDHRANNERWSFFPARVLQHLLPNYNAGGVSLLDGVPVIADVPGTVYTLGGSNQPVLERAGTGVVGWHRVLVSSGGGAGGFYYALEITNPEDPHFLWQVSTDAIGTPIFGSSTPTPAIAIVSVSIPPGAAPIQLPIAILPGGATGATLDNCDSSLKTSPVSGSSSNILVSDASNQHLLSSVTLSPPPLRCWDMQKNSGRSSGNSLTIVRLDTGKVLAHFIGKNYSGAPHNGGNGNNGGDNGHGGDNNNQKTSNNPNVYDAPFMAPLSGIPVAYPGQTGQVSDRIYIGDADGLLWRIDMSDPDISKWSAKIKLAWDSYVTDTNDKREALSVPPIISRDPIGNPVILLATGDQDTFSTQPSANHVWSLTENPITLKVSPNWHLKMPASGSRVTGPMALFNSTLYFASFLPQTGNPCSDGLGAVWGVDYIRRGGGVAPNGTPGSMAPVVTDWPSPGFPPGAPGPNLYGLDAAANTIIMGIGLSETPTCDSSSTSPDPYFGSHTAVSGASGSSYQVSWQSGAGPGVATNNTSVKNDSSVKGMQYIQPPAPGRGTRIDSWASIVE